VVAGVVLAAVVGGLVVAGAGVVLAAVVGALVVGGLVVAGAGVVLAAVVGGLVAGAAVAGGAVEVLVGGGGAVVEELERVTADEVGTVLEGAAGPVITELVEGPAGTATTGRVPSFSVADLVWKLTTAARPAIVAPTTIGARLTGLAQSRQPSA